MLNVFYGIAAPLMLLASVGNVPFVTNNPVLLDMFQAHDTFQAYLTDPVDYETRRNSKIFDIDAPKYIAAEFLAERQAYFAAKGRTITYKAPSSEASVDARTWTPSSDVTYSRATSKTIGKPSTTTSSPKADASKPSEAVTQTPVPDEKPAKPAEKPVESVPEKPVEKPGVKVPSGKSGVLVINGNEISYVDCHGATEPPSKIAGIWQGANDLYDGGQSYFVGHVETAFASVISLSSGSKVGVYTAGGQHRDYVVRNAWILPKKSYYEDIRDEYLSGYGESIVLQTCYGDSEIKVVLATPAS